MAGNFLEQLIAEWYEFKGYIVRRNEVVGELPKGGHECELDIIAFDPVKEHLIHIEPSTDASSWGKREKRYKKKFEAGRKYIPGLFKGLRIPSKIEQIAVLAFGSKRNFSTLAGGKIILLSEILEEIFNVLKSRPIRSRLVPEKYPILRTLHFVVGYRDRLREVLYT